MTTLRPTFFDAERLTLPDALDLTAETLVGYLPSYRHIAIAYSGGKDSTATVTAVVRLIDEGRIPKPESLTVLYADTRMELPPLQIAAFGILDALAARGIQTEVVLPALDEPVVKSKERYTRSRWQIDAHGFARSSGNRLLRPDELVHLPHEKIFKLFRDTNLTDVYDFEQHVALSEALEKANRLPTTFMLLQPPSWHPDVWTDVARMRSLNSSQAQKGLDQHLCPLQFDIVDRAIEQYSMPGEVVYDPFGGLMTVPRQAILAGRDGWGCELSRQYFADGAAYVEAAARQRGMPSLFSLLEDEGLECAS